MSLFLGYTFPPSSMGTRVSIQRVLSIPTLGPLVILASSNSNPNLTLPHRLSLHTNIRPKKLLLHFLKFLKIQILSNSFHATCLSPPTLSHYPTSD